MKKILTILLISTSSLFAFAGSSTVTDDEVSTNMDGSSGVIVDSTSVTQSSENMNSAFSIVDISGVSLDFLSYILKGVYAGLGIGLVLFAIRLVYKFFKSFAGGSSASTSDADRFWGSLSDDEKDSFLFGGEPEDWDNR